LIFISFTFGYFSQELRLPSICRDGVDVVQLPRDSGLAAGRNELLRHARTEFFLYFDDDFWLEDDSNVHRLVEHLVENPNVDIVGGTVSDRPEYVGFNFDIVVSDGGDGERKLIQRAVPKFASQCTAVDIVPNFFAARTASLRKVKWDPHFKLGEHEDFFIRAKKKGLSVATCSHMSVAHHAPDTSWYYSSTKSMVGYAWRRRRAFSFMQDFLSKHDLSS
jgi:glycosyltransferase involved in cell wall biosynthesis